MAKETQQATVKEPPKVLAVAGRKREGRYEVFMVSRVDGSQKEDVLKSTDDKRIAADRLQQAFMAVQW
jgi:hypothetical protein